MDSGLYAFHKASIHERRFMAKVCAALPLLFLVFFFSIVAYGVFLKPIVLLYTSAIMNTCAWLWISSTALFSIAGAAFAHKALQSQRYQERQPAVSNTIIEEQNSSVDAGGLVDAVDKVAHLIVLPNFKEDEAMLAETLHSFGESTEGESLFIVLAMEEREAGSQRKGERLKELFRDTFAHIVVTVHPADLTDLHMDGSEDEEVPGKASNLKWAVPQGFAEFQRKGFLKSVASVILTVADADCIFHPNYFITVSREFNMLRENPGADHLWTMWQAPQLPYRNFFGSVACSRIWGYISSAYEAGGVCSLSFGGTHMVFSGYSMPLQLAIDAGAWDGDVIAEDHHAFLKCFFYSARASAEDALLFGSSTMGYRTSHPRLNVRPVHLPVKSTSVSAESYWRTWVERWHQAKRHAQGVSELSYASLAAYDAFSTLPWKLQCFSLYWHVSRVIIRLWCMHLLPMCQAIALGAVTAVWIYHGGHVPICPEKPSLAHLTQMTMSELQPHMICGLAGAWVLIWPVVVPTLLVITANYLLLHVVFLRADDASRPLSIWHSEDGGAANVKRGYYFQCLATFALITWDCVFLLSAVMIPYGFIAEAAAYIDVAIYGNRVKYHTAAKPASNSMLTYGTMSKLLTPRSEESVTDTASGSVASSSSSRERSPSLCPSGISEDLEEPTLST